MMFFEIGILLAGILVGYFIAYLARDELISGREWFRRLIILSVVGAIGFWVYENYVWAWSFGFIFIVAMVGFVKSYDARFIGKRLGR